MYYIAGTDVLLSIYHAILLSSVVFVSIIQYHIICEYCSIVVIIHYHSIYK